MSITTQTMIGISVAVSLVLGVVTWRLESPATRKTMSLIVVLVTLILGVLVDSRMKAEVDADGLRTIVGGAVPRVESTHLDKVVRAIIRYDEQNGRNPDLSRFYGKLDEPMSRQLQEIVDRAEDGSIEITLMSDAMALIQDLMQSAQDSILAASYVAPASWWSTNAGAQYDSVSRALVRAGRLKGSYRRVFIYETDAERDSVARVARAQRAARIDARLTHVKDTEKGDVQGFIVIDGKVGAKLNLDQNRRFRSATFFATNASAAELSRVFRRLHQSSQSP